MRNMVIGLIGFVIGGIIGGCVAGSIHGKEYKARLKYLQDENKRLRKENRKLRNEELAKKELDISKAEIETAEEEEEEEDEDEEESDFDFDDPFPEEDEAIDAPITRSDKTESDFYSMTKEEFEEDIAFRDNETITYYRKDGIFVDSENARIDNAENFLDKETLEKVKTTDEDYLYSGNDWEDKMYEIIVEKNESFYRDIANASLEEDE